MIFIGWKLIMKTLGFTKVLLLPLMILATTMGSSIASPIPPLRNPTSEESTFTRREKPRGGKRRVTSESDWKRYYGSSDDLKRDIKRIGRTSFRREILSLHTTLGKVNYEETKQLFLHNVLTEALDDGTPMYYNSNILGRYMRKDYGNFEKNSE